MEQVIDIKALSALIYGICVADNSK